jgi:hypothetical protein
MVSLIAVLPLGCGDGLSEEDATVRCDQEVQSRGQQDCITPGSPAYDECMSCFQECGDLCQPSSECPAKYTCPED